MLGRATALARRATAVATVGLVAGLLGAGIAAADTPVAKDLSFKGDFPVIGTLTPIKAHITTSLPSPVVVGKSSKLFPASVDIDAPPDATTGLNLIGAASVEGTAKLTALITDSAGKKYSAKIQLTIPKTPTPADGQDLKFTATGQAIIPVISNTGAAVASVDLTSVSTTLTPKDAKGEPTALGTFTVDLTPDPAGQDPTLGTIQIVAAS
ncbi:hypothetical protein GCM10010174_16730 [Kutzneria viridogrisea]|uniref:DUF6801 domain-containing protein n=2 Tax=Kutzneria TaxID=43356 RepID=W5WG78_9PSEU|nr:DUF6801 domain-containing protein [Kutzneria albida]AHH99750.1 hypothetical protein KALB_6390 [Kutzneria albida DSM 43870]MBA8924927.1 hypothetical protein [Kutzneria viridogrisea]